MDSLTKPKFEVTNGRFGRYNLPRLSLTELLYDHSVVRFAKPKTTSAVMNFIKVGFRKTSG